MGDKKISLVTGASSGLGREIAKLLCEKGHTTYVVARRKEKLIELQKECKNDSGKIKIISGDLSNSNFRKTIIDQIIKENKKIDYLINNAGFGRSTKFEKQSAKEMQNMFEVNIIAYMHLTKLALKHMKKEGSGRLIHVGSVVAFTPLPYFTTYNATKSAVYAFNRSLRYELKGTNISSTVVLPARMKTGFAKAAYDCYQEHGREFCAEKFNKIAGSPIRVAKVIVRNLDKRKEVILPTFKSFIWYSTRYTGFIVDFIMKNFLGPKEKKNINKIKLKTKKGVKIK
jgi:uncharacterized protein